MGFASTLSNIVEEDYSWGKSRGLTIVSTSIVSIQYDDATKAVLETVQRADALSGQRGNSNLQASIAAGIEAAGSTEGAAGILGLGIAAGSIGLGSVQQPNTAASNQAAEGDSFAKLASLKKMLDEGLITQVDYEAAKTKLLGL
jgi:membrane protease subunit (stomatin/prohibitin family)